jgi:hypothetical protein
MDNNQINRLFHTKLFVKLGYGEDYNLGVRSLDFKTDRMEAKEACEVVKIVKGYNEYNGEKVAQAIRKIAELWPSTFQQVTFSFGRESSPVLYIDFPYWKSQEERFENREELVKKSMALLKACKPDELDENFRNCYGARAWWD